MPENQIDENTLNVEDAELMEEIGSLALESANLRYLTSLPEEEQATFVAFIEENAEADDLLPKLIESFPVFGEILNEEIAEIKKDLEELDKM